MIQPQPLPKEQFIKRDPKGVPRYNNILLYFLESDFKQDFRQRPFFQRFQSENLTLESRLHEGIRVLNPRRSQIYEQLEPIEDDLHEFYQTMRRYGDSDNVLIGDD